MACLRLVTFLPERPDFSWPRFISCMARSTFRPDFGPYLRPPERELPERERELEDFERELEDFARELDDFERPVPERLDRRVREVRRDPDERLRERDEDLRREPPDDFRCAM
jgi:hypothetical protein